MAAESSSKDPLQGPVEDLIDDLIREIFDDAGQAAKTGGRTRPAGASPLLDLVMAVAPRTSARTSVLERMLLADALAGVLADALAPALAQALVPRIMKAIGQDDRATEHDGSRATPARSTAAEHRTRKTEGK